MPGSILINVNLFGPNVGNGTSLLVPENHVQDHLLRSCADGGSAGRVSFARLRPILSRRDSRHAGRAHSPNVRRKNPHTARDAVHHGDAQHDLQILLLPVPWELPGSL